MKREKSRLKSTLLFLGNWRNAHLELKWKKMSFYTEVIKPQCPWTIDPENTDKARCPPGHLLHTLTNLPYTHILFVFPPESDVLSFVITDTAGTTHTHSRLMLISVHGRQHGVTAEARPGRQETQGCHWLCLFGPQFPQLSSERVEQISSGHLPAATLRICKPETLGARATTGS